MPIVKLKCFLLKIIIRLKYYLRQPLTLKLYAKSLSFGHKFDMLPEAPVSL